MKILRSELKRNISYLIDISAIGLVNDDLAKIQSDVGCFKIYHFYPQESLKNQKK
jgi:hypothetical protein